MKVTHRILLVLIVLAFPFALFAQPANEVGVWISTSQFEDTGFVDEGIELELSFDENIGYGVSFSHFWSQSLATEFSAQQLSADAEISISGPGLPPIDIDGGELEVMVYAATAQWHFARGSRISPYVGAGAAFVTGEISGGDVIEGEDFSTDLENEFTWLANAGINFGLTDSLSLGLDAKYIAYEPTADDDEDEASEELNPLVLSAGLKFRF
jgi:outer membrane protein W